MKRRATDQDIRDWYRRLVELSEGNDITPVPTWIAVEIAKMVEQAKKAHGGQRKGGRAKVRERNALNLGKAWWAELKAQKVPDSQRKVAEKVHDKLLPHLTVETIMRRMRGRTKTGNE